MKFKTLSEFLKNFAETRGYTYEYIGALTGKTRGLISHYANGKRNPSKDFIEKFIKSFKLTAEEKENFLFVAELGKTEFLKDMLKKSSTKYETRSNVTGDIFENFVRLPLYGMATAGNGLIEFDLMTEYIDIPKLNGNIKKSDFATKVYGDSMEPHYNNGDIIIVDVSNIDIRTLNGKEALIYYGEEKYLKRVFFEEGTGNLILKSYNPAYSDVIIKNNELDSVECKGIISVVISIRNNKWL